MQTSLETETSRPDDHLAHPEDAIAPRPAKPTSLRDVAKLAKVSVATVSMVLNNNPRISRATQQRIQRLIDQTGYRPNRLAQSLSSRYTQVLAVVLPALRHGFADAYFGEVISGICDRAGKLGHKVILEQAKPEFVKEQRHVELFERRFVDGVLCLGCSDRHTFLKDFVSRGLPAILVDNLPGNASMDYVVCDYGHGAEQVMNCLLQLGHTKIGLIYAAPEVRTAKLVADVYKRKLEGVDSYAVTRTQDGRFTETGGAAAAQAILERHPDTTALVAGNDKMALGALHYLNRVGRKVPQEISLAGFDDLQHSAFVTPTLTTIHLPLYEVGATACERLIERVRGKMDHVSEVLPTHLVLRESTAIVPR